MTQVTASVLRNRVAANVRRLRKAAGLTLAKASELADVDMRYWQKIEASEANITIGVLTKLGRALDVEPNVLLQRPPRN